jgi:hypothetical protein
VLYLQYSTLVEVVAVGVDMEAVAVSVEMLPQDRVSREVEVVVVEEV